MKRGRRAIPLTGKPAAKYPNAIGRYTGDEDWTPVHLTDDGVQVDANGLAIKQFHECVRKASDEMDAWLKDRGIIMFRLEMAVVPTEVLRRP